MPFMCFFAIGTTAVVMASMHKEMENNKDHPPDYPRVGC